jgi:hypothetical protein
MDILDLTDAASTIETIPVGSLDDQTMRTSTVKRGDMYRVGHLAASLGLRPGLICKVDELRRAGSEVGLAGSTCRWFADVAVDMLLDVDFFAPIAG